MSDLVLLSDEELKMQLRPHVFSFFYLYIVFFLLLVWAYIIYDFFAMDKFSGFPFYSFIEGLLKDSEVLAGTVIWSLGLFIVGFLGSSRQTENPVACPECVTPPIFTAFGYFKLNQPPTK